MNKIRQIHRHMHPSVEKGSKYERKFVAISSNYTLDTFCRRSNLLSLDTVKLLIHQLGYLPLNVVNEGASVVMPTGISYPLVAILYPLNANNLKGRYQYSDGFKPFPTTMWMTCPFLHSRISKLEDMGLITTFQNRLSSSSDFIAQMRHAHNLYAEYRWSLLNDEDVAIISSKPRWEEALRNVGIAGIRNFESVKCLHCHYAHYLCFPEHGNIIGLWVHETLAQMNLEDNGAVAMKIHSQQEQFSGNTLINASESSVE